MANKYSPGEDTSEYSNISVINGGVLKTIRIHEHLKFLSLISTNLLMYNPQYSDYNYNLKFEMLDRLFAEVESKLQKDEAEDGHKLRNAIRLFLVEYPIFDERFNSVTKEKKQVVNRVNLSILKEFLYKYELLIRRLHDSYGLDTRYAEEEDVY